MISSVGRRRTFSELRTDGRRVRSGVVRVIHLPASERSDDQLVPEVAFAINRSFGNAVDRNRGRRRLRAAFIEAWTDASEERRSRLTGAFLLTGSRAILSSPFERLIRDIGGCLSSLDVGHADGRAPKAKESSDQ